MDETTQLKLRIMAMEKRLVKCDNLIQALLKHYNFSSGFKHGNCTKDRDLCLSVSEYFQVFPE